MHKKIFLIGYMASGKSFLGRTLAPQWGYNFIDLDHYIVDIKGLSIADIFRTEGEDGFRKIESEALEALDKNFSENLLISTGGGTPCFNDNIKHINTIGQSIFLNCPPEIIVERLQQSKRVRPIVEKIPENELLDFVQKHLNSRFEYYLQANHEIAITAEKDDNLKRLNELFQQSINPSST